MCVCGEGGGVGIESFGAVFMHVTMLIQSCDLCNVVKITCQQSCYNVNCNVVLQRAHTIVKLRCNNVVKITLWQRCGLTLK